jgi:hypothetical protein
LYRNCPATTPAVVTPEGIIRLPEIVTNEDWPAYPVTFEVIKFPATETFPFTLAIFAAFTNQFLDSLNILADIYY